MDRPRELGEKGQTEAELLHLRIDASRTARASRREQRNPPFIYVERLEQKQKTRFPVMSVQINEWIKREKGVWERRTEISNTTVG